MPSAPGYKRDLKQERKTAIARGETGVGSDSKDARRHRARRKYEKAHGNLPPNVDVDHKKHMESGGKDSLSNLRARKVSENRSDNDHKGRNHHSKKKGK